jgi:SNF2 family DNA or RNA helicase
MAEELASNLRNSTRHLANIVTPGYTTTLPPGHSDHMPTLPIRPPGESFSRAAPLIQNQRRFQGRDLWESDIDNKDKTEEILAQAWELHEKVLKALPAWDPSPRQIRGLVKDFKPHQNSGIAMIDHLEKNYGGALLADEMGLGKTLLTLAHIREQRDKQTDRKPTLVIVDWSRAV